MASLLYKRQFGGDDDDDDNDDSYSNYYYGDDDYSWWWTPTGMAVRYAIVAILFALIILYFVGGYYHARMRLRKNLPPLAYHRWMVSRRRYIPYSQHAMPLYTQQTYYQQPGNQQPYGEMNGYAPPPPAYGAHEAPPPVYQPPQGGSKVAADQSYAPAGQQRDGQASGAGNEPTPPAAVVHA